MMQIREELSSKMGELGDLQKNLEAQRQKNNVSEEFELVA